MISLRKSPELIETINKAQKFEDVLSVHHFKDEFKTILRQIHPDVCSLYGATDAAARLTLWKNFFENGKEYQDDCGSFSTNGYWVEFNSNESTLGHSFEIFSKLKNTMGKQAEHFKKYIPKYLSANRFIFEKRCLPLSGLRLPQEHVNWILNRLLEYCAYLEEIGCVHCGLTPESVFLVPETHGIQICSFYHWTRTGKKVNTISAQYKNWYPSYLFNSKMAFHEIDIEMAKKIAAYLLGSPSGSSVPLRKNCHAAFVNFLVSHHDNAHDALFQYRSMLSKNFKKEFHSLTI